MSNIFLAGLVVKKKLFAKKKYKERHTNGKNKSMCPYCLRRDYDEGQLKTHVENDHQENIKVSLY